MALLSEVPVSPPQTAPGPAEREWLVDAEGVRKKYCRDLRRSLWYGARDVWDALTLRAPDSGTLREFEFWAVHDVSFQLRRGDSLGLLGRNGAGKSTLLKLITGQRSLTSGTIRTRGRIVALTELGLGFNPVLTGRENAYVNAAVHGLTRADFDGLLEQIIDFSGIREFIDSAVQTYSNGMKARLGFSIATHLSPDILVIDEVLAVGDLDFRRKCVKHILGYIRGGGSVILVAHDPYMVQAMCNRTLVLDKGRVAFDGPALDGVNFHFELDRNKRFNSLSEAAERVLEDAAEEANEEFEAAISSGIQPLTEPLPPGQSVAIDRVEVLAADGRELRSGHPARVLLRYRSAIHAEVTWGFSICTADLHTNIVSCAHGFEGDTSRIEPGSGTLACRLPDFPLQPGVFAIRGGIGEAESSISLGSRGYREPPDFFTVAAGEISRTNNFKMGTNDLIGTRTEWLS